jgi:MarR family transcriptional regulator, 2-MHQ and catechol-resistance regulon repressor
MRYQTSKNTARAVLAYTDLVRAADRLNKFLRRQLESFDLSMAEFGVLKAVLFRGPMSLVELSEEMIRDDTNVSHVAGDLRERGLVSYRGDEKDRRKKIVRLTEEGKTVIARAFTSHAKVVRAQMSALTRQEQDVLRRMCQKLAKGNAFKFLMEMMRADDNEED